MTHDPETNRPADARKAVAVAAVLCLAALALWWPGIVAYDSVEQYRQVLSGAYTDWHPPVMARLWAALHLFGAGAAPMFVLQLLLYWLGLGLLAAALAGQGRGRAAAAVLALGALPLFAAWQAVVLKDTQMLGAMLAAFGLAAWWRLAGTRLPAAAIAAIVLLLAYAMLVRANAVFAAMPLAAMLLPASLRRWQRSALAVLGTLAVLAVSPTINHRLLGAEETAVTRTLPIFDLAGIAHLSQARAGLQPAEAALIERRHCYQPYFWDPLGEDTHCGSIAERLDRIPKRALLALWLSAVAHHPLAYAGHRLAHLNSTDRLIVPAGRPDAAPPIRSEANDLGLGSPGPAAAAIARAGGWLAGGPLGWPALWIVAAATALCVALRQPRTASRDLALALVVSSLTLEASFAVVSIASDLRYHLWPMMAAALAVLLLADERPFPRRTLAAGAAALALVIGMGVAARTMLPRSPASYRGMLG